MIHLIGNSAGVGSSLLSQILNRHSQVFSGKESHLFTKKVLYTNWEENKSRILSKGIKGLRSSGWHLYNGTESDTIFNAKLDICVQKSNDYPSFISNIKTEIQAQTKKTIWVEKTPGNVYCFDLFLNTFEDSKVIFMVRSPLETIASMINRGMSAFNAVSRYLVSNAAGLSFENERILISRYEDLITAPKYSITKVCGHLHISFEEKMLLANESSDPKIRMEGWQNFEDGPISKVSKGRFTQLDKEDKQKVKYWINQLRVNKACNLYNVNSPNSIKEIATRLNYDLSELNEISEQKESVSYLYADLWKRTIRNYPTRIGNYPVKLV